MISKAAASNGVCTLVARNLGEGESGPIYTDVGRCVAVLEDTDLESQVARNPLAFSVQPGLSDTKWDEINSTLSSNEVTLVLHP
jgi:hypothetical protein